MNLLECKLLPSYTRHHFICDTAVPSLNPQQQAAVSHIASPLLVLAGAGSGKTSVITQKIEHLIRHCGMQAENIAAVTFTNKAAREMRARATKILGTEKAQALHISTFHTLGLTIVRQELHRLGMKHGFSIMDGDDSLNLIKDLLAENGMSIEQANPLQNQISNWKNELISPARALSLAESAGEQRMAECYKQYNTLLRAYNAVDFDDLISLPVELMREHDSVLQQWRQKIRYMMVDEYQDTNTAQYELVKMIIGDRSGLTVVGDDDQSIYAWRGARPENLNQLQTDYAGLKVIMLEQNYRSSSRILEAANTVIGNNNHVFDKKLWSDRGPGDPIRVVECENDESELDRVAAEIIDRKLKEGRRYGDFAILFRGNHQARALELALQQQQIPYQLSGGTSFFARNEIKDVMAYLRLMVNPADDTAFLRVINTPRRKIGPSTIQALGRYASANRSGLLGACAHSANIADLNIAAQHKLREFQQWLTGISTRSQQGDPLSAVRDLLGHIQYKAWLHKNASRPEVADRRMENVNVLLESLQKSLADNPGSGLADAVSQLMLQDLRDQQEEEQDETNRVQLMTLHAAKGLEFPHVYLISMEENILPHRNSIDSGTVEEERRLCYVGITRAEQTLVMSYARKRKLFGDLLDCQPSRFLDEISGLDLRYQGGKHTSEEDNQEQGGATLDSLKALLS